MELKTKTGKLVENLEKCLNDDIHELPDCRISKHTVKKNGLIQKDLSKYHEFENVSPSSFKSSYVFERCVLTK